MIASAASRARFLRGGRQFQRRIGLFVALIHDDAGARVDDLVALDEDGEELRDAMRIELDAGEPGWPFEMIDRPYPGNLHLAQRFLIRKDFFDVLGNDAAVVRL